MTPKDIPITQHPLDRVIDALEDFIAAKIAERDGPPRGWHMPVEVSRARLWAALETLK